MTTDTNSGCTVATAGEGRITLFKAKGAIDSSSVGAFRAAVFPPAAGGAAVLDLSDVDFIDATGLSAVVARIRASIDLGGQVVVIATKPHIVRLFDVIGVTMLAPVVPTLQSALLVLTARASTGPAPRRGRARLAVVR